jgi:hypothetical protein
MIPTIVLIGADKGGVGKTMTARALLEYVLARGIKARAFDSEAGKGDLARFASAEIVDLRDVQDQMRVFDGVCAGELTIVDLRATLLSPTLQAFDEAKLLDAVRAGNMRLVLLHVLGPTFGSITEIAAAAAKIGGSAKHLLVKNHINDTQFFAWDEGSRAELAKMSESTIDMPQLAEIACETLQKRGGSFLSFAEDVKESAVLRGRVRSWLEKVWREFDRVNLLGSDAR